MWETILSLSTQVSGTSRCQCTGRHLDPSLWDHTDCKLKAAAQGTPLGEEELTHTLMRHRTSEGTNPSTGPLVPRWR